jgi:protein-L-isoaspartate O-methyltransferase
MTDKIDSIKTDETLPDLSKADVTKAKKDGALDAIRESAAQQFRSTDGVAVGEADTGPQATYDVFHIQHLVDMDPDALKDMLNGKGDEPVSLTEGQIGGLLEVERSGKNRTDVVKVLCDRLGIKTPYEVTDAGPNYTNDVNRTVVKGRG